MPRFRFTLESVLRIRSRKREESLRQLGEALGELQKLEDRHRQVLSEREELRSYLKTLTENGGVDIGLVSRCQIHLSQLEQRNHEAIRACDEAREAVSRQRQQFIEADQQVKALKKIEEKQLAEHTRNEKMRELREQEEIQAGHALRKRQS